MCACVCVHACMCECVEMNGSSEGAFLYVQHTALSNSLASYTYKPVILAILLNTECES